MDADNIIYLISFLALALIGISYKFSKLFFFINLIIFLIYSFYFYYGLYYIKEGGATMGWWFYNIIITGVHLLFVLGYITISLLRGKRKSEINN